jgi:plasmid stabilization system protein ParE
VSVRLFAPRARRELRDASVWIARDSQVTAHALVTEALRAAAMLARQPMLGRRRLDLLPEPYRFWSLRGFPYLLVYNASASPPRILRVLHMARDLRTLLDDLEP